MVYNEGGGGAKKNQFKIPTRLWIFYKSEVRIYENYDAERLKEIVTISSSLWIGPSLEGTNVNQTKFRGYQWESDQV